MINVTTLLLTQTAWTSWTTSVWRCVLFEQRVLRDSQVSGCWVPRGLSVLFNFVLTAGSYVFIAQTHSRSSVLFSPRHVAVGVRLVEDVLGHSLCWFKSCFKENLSVCVCPSPQWTRSSAETCPSRPALTVLHQFTTSRSSAVAQTPDDPAPRPAGLHRTVGGKLKKVPLVSLQRCCSSGLQMWMTLCRCGTETRAGRLDSRSCKFSGTCLIPSPVAALLASCHSALASVIVF